MNDDTDFIAHNQGQFILNGGDDDEEDKKKREAAVQSYLAARPNKHQVEDDDEDDTDAKNGVSPTKSVISVSSTD